MKHKTNEIRRLSEEFCFGRPPMVPLDVAVAESICELVDYDYSAVKQHYEIGMERFGDEIDEHIFLDKQRVQDWLNKTWYVPQPKYKFSVRPIYLSLAMIVAALVVGYLLGLSNEALRNHGGNYECKTETCVRNQDETNTGSRIPK